MMGHLSHYFPNPDGFGVDEHSLPPGAEIAQLNMLSRHGIELTLKWNEARTNVNRSAISHDWDRC